MLKTYSKSGFLWKLLVVCFIFSGIFVSSFKFAQASVECTTPWWIPWTDAQRAAGCADPIKRAITYKKPPFNTLENLIKRASTKPMSGQLLLQFANGEIRSFSEDDLRFWNQINSYIDLFGKVTSADFVIDSHGVVTSLDGLRTVNEGLPSTDNFQDLTQMEMKVGIPVTGYKVDNDKQVWQFTSSSGKNNPITNVTSKFPNK